MPRVKKWGAHSHIHFDLQCRQLEDIVAPQRCNGLDKQGSRNDGDPNYPFPDLSPIINPLDEIFDHQRVGNCGQEIDEIVEEALQEVAELVLVYEAQEVVCVGFFVGLHKLVEVIVTAFVGKRFIQPIEHVKLVWLARARGDELVEVKEEEFADGVAPKEWVLEILAHCQHVLL